MENLKEIPTRDLLVGLFKFIPGYSVHLHNVSSYLIERFDISAKDIKENLDILCGKYHNPVILKFNNDYYTLVGEKHTEKFIYPKFEEEHLRDLEKLADGLLKEFPREIKLKSR